uniref:Uncharacterized protein n=1 Tax=Leptobrachium leishanense TaxID=445787 RepID=A0A8C5QR09_9ANUR
MEVLEQILTGDEESVFSVSSAELEATVNLLSNEVEAERSRLQTNQADLLSLEADTAQRSSERELYASQMVTAVGLIQRLVEEAETKEQLDLVSQELRQSSKMSDTGRRSETSSADILQKLDADTETAITSLKEKERQLSEQKAKLLVLMELAQNALTEIQLKEQRAQEELCEALRASSAQGSSRCQQQSQADALLDSCIKELGLLQLLSKKEETGLQCPK